jgi:hypothetical protein
VLDLVAIDPPHRRPLRNPQGVRHDLEGPVLHDHLARAHERREWKDRQEQE